MEEHEKEKYSIDDCMQTSVHYLNLLHTFLFNQYGFENVHERNHIQKKKPRIKSVRCSF